MISNDSLVRCLDIRKEITQNATIETIFYLYSYSAQNEMDDQGNRIIYFGPNESEYVKLEDLNGWTNLKYIKQIPMENIGSDYILSIMLSTLENKVTDIYLGLNSDDLIPLFDPNDSIKGFHGEIKYKYKLTSADELISNYDQIKKESCCYLRDGKNEEKYNKYMEISSLKKIFLKDIMEKTYLYEIKTHSGWYVANNVLLYNGEIAKQENLYK